MVVHIMTIGL